MEQAKLAKWILFLLLAVFLMPIFGIKLSIGFVIGGVVGYKLNSLFDWAGSLFKPLLNK